MAALSAAESPPAFGASHYADTPSLWAVDMCAEDKVRAWIPSLTAV